MPERYGRRVVSYEGRKPVDFSEPSVCVCG
jgi:hypothetical protein